MFLLFSNLSPRTGEDTERNLGAVCRTGHSSPRPFLGGKGELNARRHRAEGVPLEPASVVLSWSACTTRAVLPSFLSFQVTAGGGAVSRRAPPFPSRAAWFRVGVSRWPDELSRTDASLLLRKEGWGPQDERRPARAPQSAAAENEACLYLVT